MKKFFLILLAISFLFFGCAGIQQPPIPEECVDSYIYQHKIEYESSGLIIKLALDELVRQKPEYGEDIINGIDVLIAATKTQGMTYVQIGDDIIEAASKLNDRIGTKILIVADTIDDFIAMQSVLHSCDVAWLVGQFESMKAIVRIAMGGQTWIILEDHLLRDFVV